MTQNKNLIVLFSPAGEGAPAGELCGLCEKIEITLHLKEKTGRLLELPNTYDHNRMRFFWKHYDLMDYALVPRSIAGLTAEEDLYVCMDEDDLDDVDLAGYAREFFRKEILPAWPGIELFDMVPAVLSAPQGVTCRRLDRPPSANR